MNSNFKFQVFNLKQTRSKGFSLIELLVVIAMIAALLAVIFPNFMAFRQRARDTQRKSDLSQIQKALELYKLDQNPQVYPASGVLTAASNCRRCWYSSGFAANCNSGNVYMRKFPCDPGSSGNTTYIYELDGSSPLKYSLTACLENPADPDRDVSLNAACSSAGSSYTLHEP